MEGDELRRHNQMVEIAEAFKVPVYLLVKNKDWEDRTSAPWRLGGP